MNEVSRHFYKDSAEQLEYSYCLLNGNEEIANTNNIPSEIFDIVSILSNACDIPLQKVSFEGNLLNVLGCNSKGEACELQIRFHQNRLNIIAVEFPEQERRKGNLTHIYEILKNVQSMYELEKITVEDVCTQEMENWCHKFGFKEYREDYYVES